MWSYDTSSIEDISDELLIELVLVHLDLPEIDILFTLYPFEKIKKSWINNVIIQGSRLRTLNYFLAWYYFGIHNPRQYVKKMESQQIKKRTAL